MKFYLTKTCNEKVRSDLTLIFFKSMKTLKHFVIFLSVPKILDLFVVFNNFHE